MSVSITLVIIGLSAGVSAPTLRRPPLAQRSPYASALEGAKPDMMRMPHTNKHDGSPLDDLTNVERGGQCVHDWLPNVEKTDTMVVTEASVFGPGI